MDLLEVLVTESSLLVVIDVITFDYEGKEEPSHAVEYSPCGW